MEIEPVRLQRSREVGANTLAPVIDGVTGVNYDADAMLIPAGTTKPLPKRLQRGRGVEENSQVDGTHVEPKFESTSFQ